jgi:hypothetical protein
MVHCTIRHPFHASRVARSAVEQLIREGTMYGPWLGLNILWETALLAWLPIAVAFFGLPGATQSSLAEIGRWVDWAALTGFALACGAVVAAFVWPIGAMACRKPAAG